MGDFDTLEKLSDRTASVFHRDAAGLVHTCHRTIAGPGKYLVWTDCLQDVPPDQAFSPTGSTPAVTCPRCREGAQKVWGILPLALPNSVHR